MVASFNRNFPPERVQEVEPTSASEDFGCFGSGWHVPSVFWFVGGTDPDTYRKARAAGRMGDLPTNHNPRFAPVLHPTLGAGVAAAAAAAHGLARAVTITRFAVDLGVLPLALDLGGTFVFALSGAAAGVKRRLDVFGALVLALVAASSGGIVRDVLIGAVPPAALEDWRYVAVSLLAGVVVLLWHSALERLRNPVQLFDAAGLALFAVAGAHKALAFHLGPLPAALLGMLSGIGGGIVRDLLVAEVPTVLRSEIYAVAALAGAIVVVIGSALGVPSALATTAGALLCFGLRFVALRRGWRLPIAGEPEPSVDERKPRRRA